MRTIDTIKWREIDATLFARRLRGDYARRIAIAATTALAWWLSAMARRRSRVDLMEMTEDQLRDIGLTPRDARREGMRPFWDGRAIF